MSLTPTRDPAEALLGACLVTPRDPARAERVKQAASHVRPRESLPAKVPGRHFFDPENQPRGKVGQMPPAPDALPMIRPAVKEGSKADPALAFTILTEICRAYDMSAVDLMSGRAHWCGEARREAFYMLMSASGMSALEVGRLMYKSDNTVREGARRHAELHGLPRDWTRGGRPKGGGE